MSKTNKPKKDRKIQETFSKDDHVKEVKEWTKIVNGVTFFCWVTPDGLKHTSAASMEAEKLAGAAKLMELAGWKVSFRNNPDGMVILNGSETTKSEPGTIQVFDGAG